MLSYLGVWSLGLFSPTFFSTSSKKKNWSRRNTVGVGPTPYKWFLPELDLHLSREWAALAPFSQISGVGCSGSWPPLHCGDSKHLAPEVVPGTYCTLRLSHLSVGGNTRRLEKVRPTRHVGAGLRGLLGPTAHRLLGRRHPGPPPQPHGWVRFGLEVSRFPHFWKGGRACAHFPRGVEFGAL